MVNTSREQVELRVGAEAYITLEDSRFQKKWQVLCQQCLWSTPFQTPHFVNTWYRAYRDRFEPVILSESALDGSLVGLLTLANSRESGQLVVAGAHQAEYQVWLSNAEGDTSFIQKALQKLKAVCSVHSLTFRYLPPFTPMSWAAKPSHGLHYVVDKQKRPLLALDDAKKFTESLQKKSNKSRLNRLKRLGNVEFIEVSTSAGLSLTFEQIISYYDLRQAAVHGSTPFEEDPFKKRFYLALMEIPNLLHATVLMVGKETAAAHIGLRDKDKVYLGVFAHSPFFAQHSPGKLHLLMLGEKLARENYVALDLTPGDDPWKDRFATAYEDVCVTTVYFNYASFVRHRTKMKMKAGAKNGLRLVGLAPHSMRLSFETLMTKLRTIAVQRTKPYGRALRLYTFKREEVSKLPRTKPLMHRNHIQSLLNFLTPGCHHTRKEFLNNCLMRLEEECQVYTHVEHGLLLHYAWMAPRHVETFLPEVSQIDYYLPNYPCFFDIYTHPKANELERCLPFLCQILQDASLLPGAEQVYVAVLANDIQTRHALEKIAASFEDRAISSPQVNERQ